MTYQMHSVDGRRSYNTGRNLVSAFRFDADRGTTPAQADSSLRKSLERIDLDNTLYQPCNSTILGHVVRVYTLHAAKALWMASSL